MLYFTQIWFLVISLFLCHRYKKENQEYERQIYDFSIAEQHKKGILIYSDLLRSLDPKRLLFDNNNKKVNNGKVIFNNLRHRYKVALIDEFQDTDPVQLRLLHEVFGYKSNHLLLMIVL